MHNVHTVHKSTKTQRAHVHAHTHSAAAATSKTHTLTSTQQRTEPHRTKILMKLPHANFVCAAQDSTSSIVVVVACAAVCRQPRACAFAPTPPPQPHRERDRANACALACSPVCAGRRNNKNHGDRAAAAAIERTLDHGGSAGKYTTFVSPVSARRRRAYTQTQTYSQAPSSSTITRHRMCAR